MKVRPFSPDKGYRNDFLWLPLKKIENLEGLQRALTYYPTEGPPIKGYELTKHHLVVPREFIPFGKWGTLPYPIEDAVRSKFPEVAGVQMRNSPRGPIQLTSILTCLEKGSGILSLACGMGKTFVTLHEWVERRVPALIVVNTIDLEHQWKDEIIKHTTLEADQIGTIRQDVFDWQKPIVVASIQTLSRRAQEDALPEGFTEHFGFMVFDEAHHIGAPEFLPVAPLCKGIRRGLTATPARRDGLDPLYQYHIGPVLYQNYEQDIIPESFFVRTGIRLDAAALSQVRDVTGDINMARLYNWLAENRERNDKIMDWINLMLQDKRKILVLSPRVEQLDFLYSEYKDAEGVSVGLIHGKIKGEERRKALTTCDLIFASLQIAKEALDRKDLDTIVLVLPVADEGVLRQVLGRIQRPADKNVPVCLIFEDELIKFTHEMCKKMRHHLTVLQYPFDIVREP